jgi:hypothetical protein
MHVEKYENKIKALRREREIKDKKSKEYINRLIAAEGRPDTDRWSASGSPVGHANRIRKNPDFIFPEIKIDPIFKARLKNDTPLLAVVLFIRHSIIMNVGNEPPIISRVVAVCECSILHLDSDTILPQKKATLTVTFKTNGLQGLKKNLYQSLQTI